MPQKSGILPIEKTYFAHVFKHIVLMIITFWYIGIYTFLKIVFQQWFWIINLDI